MLWRAKWFWHLHGNFHSCFTSAFVCWPLHSCVLLGLWRPFFFQCGDLVEQLWHWHALAYVLDKVFLSFQVVRIYWGLSWCAEPSKMFMLEIFTICSLKKIILVCTGPVKYFTDFIHLFWEFSNTANKWIPYWQQNAY